MKNVFLINSSLLALNTWLLISENSLQNCQVFIEGTSYHFPQPRADCTIIEIENTRGRKWELIRRNNQMLRAAFTEPFQLFISDPYWPQNSAALSIAYKSNNLDKIFFLDEGFVLYWHSVAPTNILLRSWARFFISRLKTGEGEMPLRLPFRDTSLVGGVFCLLPELKTDAWPEVVESIPFGKLKDYAAGSIDTDHPLLKPAMPSSRRRALFLGQPHYRRCPHGLFLDSIKSLKAYLISEGYDEIWLKPHPSEDSEAVNHYYSILDSKIFSTNLNLPIEAFSNLLMDVDIISFNSSSLLYLKKLGFKGNVVSFDFERICGGKHNKSPRKYYEHQKYLLSASGVQFVSIM